MNQGRLKTEQRSGLSVQNVLEYSREYDGALFNVALRRTCSFDGLSITYIKWSGMAASEVLGLTGCGPNRTFLGKGNAEIFAFHGVCQLLIYCH